MKTIFRIALYAFIAANIILAIAIAYVLGEMSGVQSQRPTIEKLMREKYSDLIIDFGLYEHPLRQPLWSITALFGMCWFLIAVDALARRKRTNHEEEE